jgi:hypothetical protein
MPRSSALPNPPQCPATDAGSAKTTRPPHQNLLFGFNNPFARLAGFSGRERTPLPRYEQSDDLHRPDSSRSGHGRTRRVQSRRGDRSRTSYSPTWRRDRSRRNRARARCRPAVSCAEQVCLGCAVSALRNRPSSDARGTHMRRRCRESLSAYPLTIPRHLTTSAPARPRVPRPPGMRPGSPGVRHTNDPPNTSAPNARPPNRTAIPDPTAMRSAT